jgi:hypothetical protein
VPNNPNLVPTSVTLSLQQLITTTANIPPTIDAPAFANPMGEFFQVLELDFSIKNFEKILQLATFSRQKDETFKMFYVATPLWPSVGVKPNTWKSWRFGALRDSRMFRAQQQGSKHLALKFSWCHWKGLKM